MIQKRFYETAVKLDELKIIIAPTPKDLQYVMEIIRGDQELTRNFYEKNKQGALNAGWLELLNSVGEFAELGAKEASLIARIKALYLVDCASVKPETVLEIIKKLDVKDSIIQSIVIDAILKMPIDIAVKGVSVVLDYIGKREYKALFDADKAAKLMVKLTDNYPGDAFKIAKALLDVWRPGEKEAGVFERIRSKFATHEYKELIFSYYSKVWEKQPFEAILLMVDIYDKYLDECFKEKNYDVSEYLGVSLRDMEDDYHLERDIEAIIMKAMCEAGRAVITKEQQEISELLNDLEKRNKGIFHRVEMYLLRFVPSGTEKERINKLIGNQKFIESPLYKYEHRHLLNDKFDEVSEETRKRFVEWVNEQKITEERKKEVEEWCRKNKKELPDFEKWESQRKGEELYLVRERFKELYEQYKAKSGLDDSALAPERMVNEARCISPTEGSPLSPEQMAKMTPDETLDYILEPKNYEGKKDADQWSDPIEGLSGVFKDDAKKRPLEYLKGGREKLEKLPPRFLSRFFYGIEETVGADAFSQEGWRDLLDFGLRIVAGKRIDTVYTDCFRALLSVLRDGFTAGKNKIDFNDGIARKLADIVEPLVYYPVEDKEAFDKKQDPMHLYLNTVAGQAIELVVLLATECRQGERDWYGTFFKERARGCWNFALEKVRKPGVNCVFGTYFARIYWLDREWVQKKIEDIFGDELWDETWGTYVTWGRPSPECFGFLVERGKYGEGVKRLGRENKYKYQKEPDNGLVEHLMIGYFNGWVGLESDVLKRFFEKASAELRGKAARFLTTGFKPTKDGKDEKYQQEVAERMKAYWTTRLAAIQAEGSDDKTEAIELTGWVENSLLPAKETLELLDRSLELSGGKIGQMRNAKSFVEGVCTLGKGNELLGLRCLKRASVDKNIHSPWSKIEEPLVKFLEELPEEVRSEGKEVADLYGRYNPDKYRGVWEKLRKGVKE